MDSLRYNSLKLTTYLLCTPHNIAEYTNLPASLVFVFRVPADLKTEFLPQVSRDAVQFINSRLRYLSLRFAYGLNNHQILKKGRWCQPPYCTQYKSCL